MPLLVSCYALILFALLSCISPATMAIEAIRAPQQFAQMGNITLESGATIENCALGYRTAGQLNSTRSNAILMLTWHTGKSADLLPLLDSNKLFDPAPYFVIMIDAIGNGVSCSPSNSVTQHGKLFPTFSIRDMVGLQHRFITEVLQLPRLHAVIGYSMGALQSFEWMHSYPEWMRVVIPISGTPAMSSYDQLFWRTEEWLIENDPEYAHGDYAKNPDLKAMQLVFSMNFTSPAHRIAETKAEDFPAFFAATMAVDPNSPDANDWLWQARAMLTQNLQQKPRDKQATKTQSKPKTLIVVSQHDHLINPQAALDFARQLNTKPLVLTGTCGHLAMFCEMDKIRPMVMQALRLDR